MRIRGRKHPADCSASSSPSSSSSTSYSSSLTSAHSLASSQESSNSSPFSLSPTASPRCYGLDLLVKAIYQVTAGSVVGVPYIQRRVTIRRKRRLRNLEFDAFMFQELSRRTSDRITKKVNIIGNDSSREKKQKGKKSVRLPARTHVLQPWGRRSELSGEMGL